MTTTAPTRDTSTASNSESPPAVSIRDLRIDYGSHIAVHGMDLDIPAGVIYGLVGPNGAGKTSTFKAITSLLEPTNGSINIAGYDIVKHRRHAQAIIGYMPDMAPVPTDLKLWEFLELYAGSHGLYGKEKADRISECLEMVELDHKTKAYCKSLSRGMMQRLVLAKTMLHRPRTLILDEPASGMDVRSRVTLRNILRNACSEGATVLVSSHILSELSEMCDMIGILHQGNLLSTGTVDEVLQSMTSLQPDINLKLATPVAQQHEWQQWLESQENVSDVKVHSPTDATFHFWGEPIDFSALLLRAHQDGYSVFRVSERQRNLENILLELEYETADSPSSKASVDSDNETPSAK